MENDTNSTRKVAYVLVSRFKSMSAGEFKTLLYWQNYRGFLKCAVPQALLAEVCASLGIDPKDIQAEIVRVDHDLSHQVHHHISTKAYVICLGPSSHAPAPQKAFGFLRDTWFPISEGSELEIPPYAEHGFTVETGGTLTFLSVQDPPIVSEQGDDYVVRGARSAATPR